jgi:hypothetical protein
MKRLLALACIFLPIAAVAGDKELRLPFGREVFTLHPFSGTSPHNHYFGEYRFPIEYTGGTKLHLFPNGRFVISEWLDIGPDELQAAGTFRLDGDQLSLQFTRVRPGHEELKTKFSDLHLLYGRIEKKDYVTGFEVFVFPADAWQALKANPGKADYLRRGTEYNDWQTILRDYEAQKE